MHVSSPATSDLAGTPRWPAGRHTPWAVVVAAVRSWCCCCARWRSWRWHRECRRVHRGCGAERLLRAAGASMPLFVDPCVGWISHGSTLPLHSRRSSWICNLTFFRWKARSSSARSSNVGVLTSSPRWGHCLRDRHLLIVVVLFAVKSHFHPCARIRCWHPWLYHNLPLFYGVLYDT